MIVKAILSAKGGDVISIDPTATLDTAALQPLARCGYADYAVVDEVFAIARPTTARRTAAE